MVAEKFTSDQLFAIAARLAAQELAAQMTPKERPAFDLATAVALDLDAAVRHIVDLWHRGMGIDVDILGAWLLPQIEAAGVGRAAALDALQRTTGWRPRTEAERLEAVAREMLADGFTPAQITDALRCVVAQDAA